MKLELYRLKRNKKDTSPRGSPTGPSILVDDLDGGATGSVVLTAADQTASPRRLGFFEQFQFRQRSKSDTRPKKLPVLKLGVGQNSSSIDDPLNRPPMMTIPSVDEDNLNSPPRDKTPERLSVKPLFIDTKLANTNRKTHQQHVSLSARSPVTHVVDFVRHHQHRRRNFSGSTSSNAVSTKMVHEKHFTFDVVII